MIFAIVIALNFKIKLINIKTAFLYKAINEEIYIKQLIGLENGIKKIY